MHLPNYFPPLCTARTNIIKVYIRKYFFPPVSNRLSNLARPTAGETILITKTTTVRIARTIRFIFQSKKKYVKKNKQ